MAQIKYKLYVTHMKRRIFTTTDTEKHEVDKLYRLFSAKFSDVDGYWVGIMRVDLRLEMSMDIKDFYKMEEKA